MKLSGKQTQSLISWQKRLQYGFDNFMSKGGFSVFLALLSAFFGAFVVMTVARYIIEWYFPNENVSPADYENFPWDVFVQLIGLRDTGDNANLATKFVGVLTIFLGLVLFSSLVAFITQEFETKLQSLRKGKSIVVEQGHTLILGFGDRVIDIIKELVVANESEKDAVIVILSQENKEDMDDFLRNNMGDVKTTRIVTRNGSITSTSDLTKVAVKDAKSVIVLNDAKTSDQEEAKILADARVLKAILAVMAAHDEEELPSMVVELHSEQYRKLAENLVSGVVITLNEADILARILVQTSRSAGLAAVYLNLVGFEGNEFYFYRPNSGWNGLTFGQLPFHFSEGTPLGVRHSDGSLKLGTSKDYQLAEDDEVVILAEDDSAIQFYPEALVKPKGLGYGAYRKTLERKPEKYLIMNWNSKAPIALREYAKYLVEGSQVNLTTQELTDEVQTEFDKIAKDYPHIRMESWQINLDSLEQLVSLKPYEYDSISILAGRGESAEEMDAKTLTILLQLRQVFRDHFSETGHQVKTELIAEIIDSQDTDLVIKAGVKDFLLTNQLVSKILAQASQEPNVMSIYRDLFAAEGSELYIKPISLYFPAQQIHNLTFADCILAAQQRSEVCIGLRYTALAQDSENNFGVNLVPKLDQQLNFTINDALITLAEDET